MMRPIVARVPTENPSPMLSAEAHARRLAERRHGVVAHRELRAVGLTRDDIAYLCGTARWERASDEVLKLQGAPRSTAATIAAAVLDAGAGARLSDLSAAARWGLAGCRLWPLTACTSSTSRRRSELIKVNRVRRLPDRWCTELDGIPIIRPELLAVRLFALEHPLRAATLTDRLWSMRLLSGPSIASLLDDMGARGRNGIAGLRTYLKERGPGYVPPASNLESRVKQILLAAGIAVRCQVDSGGDRWTGRVDFRCVDWPVIIEVQSEAHHSALVDRRADEQRLAALRASGFEVVELWDTTVWSDAEAVVRAVEAAIRRCRAVS
jgi:very-short-patch-repair endonuclease